VLPGYTVEDTPHFFLGEAFVSLVVEPRNLLPVRVVPNHPMEDTNAAGAGMLHSFADLIEGDLLVANPAQNDGRTPGDGRQDVDAVTILKRLRRVDEITIHCEAHALEERRQRRESIDDGATELGLRDARGGKLERRAVAAGEFLGGGIVVNADFHATGNLSRHRTEVSRPDRDRVGPS
jgi:hypothetical protein